MSEKARISKATSVMGVATGLSRVAGLIRDMVVAGIFGAGFATDAFFMAFTIPNLLRRFFAEGSLTAAFVPTFSDVLHKQGADEARKVASICWTLLMLVLAVVMLAGVLGSPLIVKGIGFGFSAVEGKLALTDHLNRIMFPYIFFVSLLALVTGILNVFGKYFWPSLSPLFLNLCMILCALFFSSSFDVPITALAVGVLLGGIVQFVIQIPVLKSVGVRLRFNANFRHPAVRRIATLMLPGIAGVAIYQINVVVTRLLASFLPEGSVSFLYYGQRLFEFPQGIFIVSLAQAVLPSMSRQAALGDTDGLKESLRFALVLIGLITIPAALGLMLCSQPVFSLFFMSGKFSYEDVRQSALALAFYAPGLLFVGASRVIVPAFYAMKNTRTPVWISFWTLLVNAGLGLALMGPMKHLGLALALTLSSVFNCILLVWALRRRYGRLGLKPVFLTFLRLIPVSAVMAATVWYVLQFGTWSAMGNHGMKAVILVAAVCAGVLVYALGCMAMRIPEASDLYGLLRKKILRRA